MTGTQDRNRHLSDVVQRAKTGDTAAFEELYHENLGRVYALCMRMTRNKTQAEDLTQEGFIRAWQKLNSFRGDSAFSTWLHRLTVNLVLTELKTQKRKTEKVFSTDDLTPFEKAGTTSNPGIGMDLERAIASLPSQARKIFVLYRIEGYKHEEIANMLKIATGTTKAQLHRARKMLRKVLA
jgi:RNA polymerase sigma-70 factor (ECF subfamily)